MERRCELTHKVWQLFNVNPLGDVEPATPLFPRGLAYDRYRVLGSPQPIQRSCFRWRRLAVRSKGSVGRAKASSVGRMGNRIRWHLGIDCIWSA